MRVETAEKGSLRKNTVISPNFLKWWFCEKAQAILSKLCTNCAFPQNFHSITETASQYYSDFHSFSQPTYF